MEQADFIDFLYERTVFDHRPPVDAKEADANRRPDPVAKSVVRKAPERDRGGPISPLMIAASIPAWWV